MLYVIYSALVISLLYSSCRDRGMISIDSGSLVLLDPATPTVSCVHHQQLLQGLGHVVVQEGGAEGGDTAGEDDQGVETWRVETHGEGVGAHLLGD